MSATATNSSEPRGFGWPALAAAAAVMLAAWVWFVLRAPPDPAPPMQAARPATVPLSAGQLQRGIERAQADVKRNPQDAAAWAMLAHSAEMAGRLDEAVAAYRRLLALRPQDAQIQVDLAAALEQQRAARARAQEPPLARP